ncbi:hypothetical protein RQP46_001286 [Phenoliferia psychrophenolica]
MSRTLLQSRLSLGRPLRLSQPPRQLTTASATPPPAAGRRNLFSHSAFLTLGVLSGFTLALVAPRPNLLAIIFPVPTPVSPGADTPEGRAITAQIEAGLQALPLVASLRAAVVPDPTTPSTTSLNPSDTTKLVPAYTESRPYATSVPGPHSLSTYTLRGPGKFAIPPLVFTTRDQKESIFVIHVGGGMCGHEGIVHGGLLATILDESLARTAFYSLPNQIGVTATLGLKYKKPTFANQYLVVRTETVDVKGRKVWVKGHIETLEGERLVEADLLDTLEPSERTSLVSKILSGLSLSDLTAIPLASGQAIVNAHASAEQTSALLRILPELQGRLRVISHESLSIPCGAGHNYGESTSINTTFEITPAGTEAPYTLSVALTCGSFSDDDSSGWATLNITGSRGRTKARLEYSSTAGGMGGRSAFETSGLTKLFTTLATDLELPVTSTPHTKAYEPMGGESLDENKWVVPELKTPDAVQRDKTFGRLIRIIIPKELLETTLSQGLPEEYIRIKGEVDDDEEEEDVVENVLRGAAVAGFDIDHESDSY